MNSSLFPLLSAFIGGGFLGMFFFGGLWWSLRKSLQSAYMSTWLIVSFFVRFGFVLPGFYFLSHGHWAGFLACLLGFLIARYLVAKGINEKVGDYAPES